jgi:catechol 2,3-dioxygenase-like lactoylglutathione lyase family enzyme
MRGVALFVAGVCVGLTIQGARAQSGTRGVEMMNHVGFNVQNIPEAVGYYTSKMGYKEAFRVTDDKGQPTLVYLHISGNTFLELNQATPERAPGFTHYGLVVDDANAAVTMFRQRGVTVTPTNVSAGTKAVLANITDPYTGRIELVEITPQSLHRKAIQSWRQP